MFGNIPSAQKMFEHAPSAQNMFKHEMCFNTLLVKKTSLTIPQVHKTGLNRE